MKLAKETKFYLKQNEDKGYFRDDLTFELTEKSLNDSFEGTGFIKTIRTLSN